MERLSSGAEKLLRDIFEHRNEKGSCDLTYWKKRFDDLESNFSLEVQIHSQFSTLHNEKMIDVQWANNVPYMLFILDRGFEYYERFLQKGGEQMSDVKVFVSYNQKTGSDFTDALEQKLEGKAIVVRDKSGIESWGSISDFMNSIREQDFAVAVITDEYLKSQPCMFEIATMMRERNWQNRIIPAVIDISIYKRKLEYVDYWSKQKMDLEEKLKTMNGLEAISAFGQDINQIKIICAEISDFLTFVLDRKNPPIYTVLDEIERRVLAASGRQHISMEHQEKTEVYHITPVLSRFAQELLVKAAKAEKRIMFMQDMSGYYIGLDGEGGDRTSRDRTVALWKDAITKLKELMLIEQSDTKGQIYQLTNKGYEIAKEIEVELMLDRDPKK